MSPVLRASAVSFYIMGASTLAACGGSEPPRYPDLIAEARQSQRATHERYAGGYVEVRGIVADAGNHARGGYIDHVSLSTQGGRLLDRITCTHGRPSEGAEVVLEKGSTITVGGMFERVDDRGEFIEIVLHGCALK